MSLFVLFENASGYALFEQTESDEIAQLLEEMQDAMTDLSRWELPELKKHAGRGMFLSGECFCSLRGQVLI